MSRRCRVADEAEFDGISRRDSKRKSKVADEAEFSTCARTQATSSPSMSPEGTNGRGKIDPLDLGPIDLSDLESLDPKILGNDAPAHYARKRSRITQKERAKAILSRKRKGRGKKLEKTRAKVQEHLGSSELDEYEIASDMASAYELKLKEYKKQPYLKYLKNGRLDKNSRNYKSFLYAAIIANMVGMEFHDYVEAQFFWFHKWFKRPPTPYQLCGMSTKFPAPERATKWRELMEGGSLERGRSEVVSSTTEIHIPAGTYVKYGRRLLQDLMDRRGMTEEEILLMYGAPELGYFHPSFLRVSDTWKRLKREGRV